MNFTKAEALARLEAIRERRRRHILAVGTLVLIVSTITFGVEMLGIGTVFGVVGLVVIFVADL